MTSTYEKAVKFFKARPELLDAAIDTVLHHTEEELSREFDELVNERPEIEVLGYFYPPATVLKEVDPIAYRQELLAFIDGHDTVEIGGRLFDEGELLDFMEQYSDSEVV